MIPIEDYHRILHPQIPSFLVPFLHSPAMQRLKGVGLFCGVDYSCLFNPLCFYSRYDHSLGVALITWHFTQSVPATLAALFHDLSTPAFSHVIDFKHQDYLQQEFTESINADMILADAHIQEELKKQDIDPSTILHDDAYPIANQPTPHICADRLEYMFSTGLYLTQSFDLATIKACYQDLKIGCNASGMAEPSFHQLELARTFFQSCLAVSRLFLDDRDKITLQLLAQIIERALCLSIISEADLYIYDEKEILTRCKQSEDQPLKQYLSILANQTKVLWATQKLPNSFCAKLKVKVRYIDPLWRNQRLSTLDTSIKQTIGDLFIQSDHYIVLPYCAVKY